MICSEIALGSWCIDMKLNFLLKKYCTHATSIIKLEWQKKTGTSKNYNIKSIGIENNCVVLIFVVLLTFVINYFFFL